MIFIVTSCSGKKENKDLTDDLRKIDPDAEEKIAIDPASISGAALVVTAESTSLEVTEGPLIGAAVQFAAGSIAVGSTLTIQGSKRPEAFSQVNSDEASIPTELSVLSATGEEIKSTSSVLTVNLPLDKLALMLLENDYENLCVLGQPADTSIGNLVWRRDEISIIGDIAQIKTIHFGVFQAVYCGTEAISGFTEVEFDVDAPVVLDLYSPQDPGPGTVSNFSITVNYSEAVTGFGLDDLELQNATASNLTGSGLGYSFDVTATGYGEVSVTIPAGSVADLAGNMNSDSMSWGNTYVGTCGDTTGCYDSIALIEAGMAFTPEGKQLVYDFANGVDGFMVWKEEGGNRILNASGKDFWAYRNKPNGKGYSATVFTDAALIAGRVCPDNVYVDDPDMFNTEKCLYYSEPSGAQKLNAVDMNDAVNGLKDWNVHTTYPQNISDPRWYIGNIKTCSDKGMRLPTIYETTAGSTTSEYYPDSNGSPIFAGSLNGVPTSNPTWTATSYAEDASTYWSWGGFDSYDFSEPTLEVICVLP